MGLNQSHIYNWGSAQKVIYCWPFEEEERRSPAASISRFSCGTEQRWPAGFNRGRWEHSSWLMGLFSKLFSLLLLMEDTSAETYTLYIFFALFSRWKKGKKKSIVWEKRPVVNDVAGHSGVISQAIIEPYIYAISHSSSSCGYTAVCDGPQKGGHWFPFAHINIFSLLISDGKIFGPSKKVGHYISIHQLVWCT